jgi:iron complex transport system permease protein
LPVFRPKMEIQFIRKRFWLPLFLALLGLFALDISLGSVPIPFAEILTILTGKIPADETWISIIFNFRLTKALTCVLAGAALAVGGLQMQTLFRNPLAGPDVFGLSSGASLAV